VGAGDDDCWFSISLTAMVTAVEERKVKWE
jgi:hypothetical protein